MPITIALFTKTNIKSNNIEIYYGEKIKYKKNKFEIYLNFAISPIHNLNKFNSNFYFLKLKNKKNDVFYIKFKDIFNENNSYSFSEVNSIIIYLQKNVYTVIIEDKTFEIKNDFDFDSVSKINILDNFYGQIESIIVIKKDLSDNKQIIIEIKGNKEGNKAIYEIKSDGKQNSATCGGTIFHSKNNFNNDWKKGEKELNEIEYFGGFNCFIPLFKILKKFIINLKEKNGLNYEIKDNNEYVMNILNWIKDILKIMLKLICYSENNYNNLKKVMISLISSLAEICECLNDLIDKNIIDENIKSILFKDEIIYSMFVLIILFELPFNIINTYINLFEIKIKDNFDIYNYNYVMDYMFLDITKNNINLEWYFSLLFNYFIFDLFFLDSPENITNILYEKLEQIANYSYEKNNNEESKDFLLSVFQIANLINNLKRKDNYDNDKNNDILNDLFIEKNTYFKNIVNLIKIYMNVKFLIKNFANNYEENIFMKKIYSKLMFKNNTSINFNSRKNQIQNIFKNYLREFDFLKNLFSFLQIQDFQSKSQLLMNELIDYHRIYHQLMKELFVFNRLWSKQKLFYNSSDNKVSNLKYKNINYYTNNYQRPIIYPVLDIKYRYPKFSIFKGEIFYYIAQKKDDYYFDLDCSRFDKIIEDYDKKIFERIAEEKSINKYKICLVKQNCHVKGNLFIINENHEFIIYFYSHSYDFKTKTEIKTLCNKSQDNNKSSLCYGSIFKCLDKEKNRKLILNIKDIRMILKRIYYFRKSGIEIFTTTKSYYFNFYSEEELNNFFNIFNSYLEESKPKLFYPIIINNNINLGYIKINIDIISENGSKKLSENFIEFLEYISKEKHFNLCVFDIIILINLISNRSYIDLNQYPVFPILHFYEKGIEIKRKLEEHIGFQDSTKLAKSRKEDYENCYAYQINETNINRINILDEEEIHYFNINYSNIVYVTNFMIRLFPYSFIAIELQGNGFDDPNRIFSSIEETFFNITYQKSDIRELIPQFFYFPEMFLNINFFHFRNKDNEELVDIVTMPKLLTKYEKVFNLELKDYDKGGFNVINNSNIQIQKRKIFIFVDYMKKKLESLNGNNLSSWLNIIFGEGQKYRYKGKRKGLLFRPQSYIDIDEKTFIKYSNDDIIMKSVEFGLIPLKTIYDCKYLNNYGNNYEKTDESSKKAIERIKSSIKNNQKKNEKQKLNNKEKDLLNYIEFKTSEENIFNKNNLVFKIDNKIKSGKVELYNNDNLISEIFDHNDKITDIFYNPRLNMFGSTSYDSFALIYFYPNKLISIIKHPNKLYFDKIFLSSNPFPTIITFEKKENLLISYSLSGIIIKEKKLKTSNELNIEPIFNTSGGRKIDKILVYDGAFEIHKLYKLPFFDEIIFDE